MYSKEEVIAASTEYFDGDDLAANVFLKYALQDKDGMILEKTPEEMFWRIAKEIERVEKKLSPNNPLTAADVFKYIDKFRHIVFQGSPMAGIGNSYQNVSVSNCSVLNPPIDQMSSIFTVARDMANLYKRRFGVGIDISNLRPDGAYVSNSAKTSSGAWSFCDFYSFVTRMIGQKNRRGALMLTMDVRHPDIFKFITMKHDKTKVTGANVSVKINDDFMNCVQNDSDYTLQWPIDSANPKYFMTVKARDLFEEIVSSSTTTAEPGVLFWDTVLKRLPAQCYADVGFNHTSTNPCSELPLSEDSCRLISINLKHFVKNPFSEAAFFDKELFKDVVQMATRLSDDLVEIELEKLDVLISVSDSDDEKELYNRFKKSCAAGRRTGLGTHGLADMLARMGIRYDTNKAVEFIDSLYELFKITTYGASVNLAKERGAFPVFDWEKEKDNEFLNEMPQWLLEEMKQYGRRGISLLTCAPTGSVSILSQTSSGIEPVFRNSYFRKKKKNHNDVAQSTDFVDLVGDRWEEFEVFHHNVLEWKKSNPDAPLPDFFVESNIIDWRTRIAVQAAITKHLDHSVSSTINLPAETDSSVVAEIYTTAWRMGCKGMTVYVDGSRDGVLTTKKSSNMVVGDSFIKRPRELECDIHHVSIKGDKWTILIGLVDERPYEVFAGKSEFIEIPKSCKSGSLFKERISKSRNTYSLQMGDWVIKDVVKVFDNPDHGVFTRLVSLGLRHGAGVQYVIEQLSKDLDSDFNSLSKVIARVLKKYIKDGTRVGGDKECPECSAKELVYESGCVTCKSCGYSKCS